MALVLGSGYGAEVSMALVLASGTGAGVSVVLVLGFGYGAGFLGHGCWELSATQRAFQCRC